MIHAIGGAPKSTLFLTWHTDPDGAEAHIDQNRRHGSIFLPIAPLIGGMLRYEYASEAAAQIQVAHAC